MSYRLYILKNHDDRVIHKKGTQHWKQVFTKNDKNKRFSGSIWMCHYGAFLLTLEFFVPRVLMFFFKYKNGVF